MQPGEDIVFAFQSTHPIRDATMTACLIIWIILVFQSTHPIRDATDLNELRPTIAINFNPRIPLGMRPEEQSVACTELRTISIHASH